MRPRQNKAYLSAILFLMSPFFSLLVILREIYLRRKWALTLFACFIGILCYLYLPSVIQDGAKRYFLYEQFKQYTSYSQFYEEYLQYRADYVFYSLIYFFSAYGIKYQILVFLLGFFNAYVPLYIFNDIIAKRRVQKDTYFKFFLLIILTYSLSFLFSGVRNNIAYSFLFLAFYLFYFKNKTILPIILYGVGLLSHFSIIVYLPVLLMIKHVRASYLYFILGVIFLFNFILPADFVQSLFLTTDVGDDIYNDKIQAYSSTELAKEDSTTLTLLAKTLFSVWFYVSLLYVFITRYYARNKDFFILFIAFAIPVIIFIAFPGISNRYMFGAKFFFALLLIIDSFYFNNKKWQYIFIILFLIQPLYDITRLLTQSFIAGYIKLENISLITILMTKYSYKDMLPPY